eukprot:TRINITY_DN2121_c0_g2_i1.p1 TRINITY_DN2121_c0_g2~~TRINITY_DN2121_c0_g2_i1.p1  ORF type:complete len:123 (-),score=3.74 TRINITY_DN2121_c0_g2_i1:119-487(-)
MCERHGPNHMLCLHSVISLARAFLGVNSASGLFGLSYRPKHLEMRALNLFFHVQPWACSGHEDVLPSSFFVCLVSRKIRNDSDAIVDGDQSMFMSRATWGKWHELGDKVNKTCLHFLGILLE